MPEPNQKELSDLEKLLAALSPRPANLDRDPLMRWSQPVRRPGGVPGFGPALVGSMSAACVCLMLDSGVAAPRLIR